MIYDIFYIRLLKKDVTRKKWLKENNLAELDIRNNKGGKYKINTIWDSAVYRKNSKSDYFPKFYYMIFGKDYLEKENT